MLKNFKAAIFDMDGTLIDSLMLWDIIWKEFGNKFLDGKKFIPLPDDDKAVRTMTLKDAMILLHSKYNLGENPDVLLNTANNIIETFYSNEVRLKSGVLKFLEYCYTNNIKMCIASATDKRFIEMALEHCGAKKYFIDILSCAEIGKGKDKPDIYIKALECLGVDKEQTYIFEDSHIAVQTANGIGIKTVGIYDQFNNDQDELKNISTIYLGEGETLEMLIN